jgi:hypothetical protein
MVHAATYRGANQYPGPWWCGPHSAEWHVYVDLPALRQGVEQHDRVTSSCGGVALPSQLPAYLGFDGFQLREEAITE